MSEPSKQHAVELGRFSTRNNFYSEALRRNEVFVLTYMYSTASI